MAKKQRPDSARVSLRDSARVALRDSARVGIADSARVGVRDSARVGLADSARVGVRDSAVLSVGASSRVTVSASLAVSQLHSAVLRMLGLTDSVALTIRGDAKQIASAVVSLSERVSVNSARLSISGIRGSSTITSVRGDKKA